MEEGTIEEGIPGPGPTASDRSSIRWVLGIGSASLGAYFVVVAAQREISLGSGIPHSLAAYSVATVVLFVLYGAILRLAALGRILSSGAQLLTIVLPLAANLLFLASAPRLSTDTLSYVAHGSIATDLGLNPHVTPEAIVDGTALGPELRERGWGPGHPPSPYGPMWTAVEVAVSSSIVDVDDQVLAFKTVAMLAGWSTAALIWMGLGSERPERRLLGVVAFLWNPLVIAELAGEGHNDALMTMFAVGAVVLTVRRHAAVVVALTAAVVTKYLPLILAPLLVPAWFRASNRPAGAAARRVFFVAAAALLVIVAYAPWWAGLSTFDGVRRIGRPGDTGSTPTLATQAVERILGLDVSGAAAGLAIAMIGAISLLVAARHVADASLPQWCAGFATFYLLALSPVYWPWYAVFPVALLCLRPGLFAMSLALAFSLGARLAAPLDVLVDHGAIGRPTFLFASWLLGIGLPLTVIAMTVVVKAWRTRRGPSRAAIT